MGFSASAAASTAAPTAAGASGAAGAAGAANPLLAQFSVMSSAAGALQSMFGAYYGAKTQKINLRHSAAMAEINARIADLGAESALMQGQSEVARLTQQAGQLKSRQRVALAANGVDLGVGNAAELQASTDIMKEIDTETITANAVKNAWGYRTNAMNLRSGAAANRVTAGGINPFAQAATSLIGSSTQVASQWYGLQQSGAFGTKTDVATGKTTNAWW